MLHQENQCNNCRAINSLKNCYKEGSLVCTSCGYVAVSRFIDETAEYRIFNDDANGLDPTRTGVFFAI
jgi:transcription initiation factor TFIIIB Brf1 subunit/transcription initiation factor TFIIB